MANIGNLNYICGVEEKKKKAPAKKKRGNYENKLQVKGSFMDIMKAAVEHADKNSAKKK